MNQPQYNQGQPMQQQDDKTFVNGMRIERKFFQNGGSIDKVGINVNDFIQFLQQHASPTGWVNFDIKTSQKTGQPYAELNTWKPQQQAPQQQYQQQAPQQQYQQQAPQQQYQQQAPAQMPNEPVYNQQPGPAVQQGQPYNDSNVPF